MIRDPKELPPLSPGSHRALSEGACIMEAASWMAGEEWSDHPVCVSPIIAAFLRIWNDGLPEDECDALLRPLILPVLNTRSTPEVERRRALMAADWLVRKYTPTWLRLAKLDAQADAFVDLPEIAGQPQHSSLLSILKAVRNVTGTAKDAAMAKARDAIENAISRSAAGAGTWLAATAAIKATAGLCACVVPVANPLAVSLVAEDAALAIAWTAAKCPLAETWAEASAAARSAAEGALHPTRLALQQSAITLVHRMIPNEVAA